MVKVANRYANLVGGNLIKDEWQKINTGFDAVQAEMDGKVSKSGDTMTGNLNIQSVLPLVVLRTTDDSQGPFTGLSHRNTSGSPIFTAGYSPVNQRWGVYDHILGGTSFYIQGGSGNNDLRYKNQPVWHGYNNPASLLAVGYQILASGLIVQWGSVSVPQGETVTVTFPIAFPTACRGVQLTAMSSTAAVANVTAAPSTTSFNVNHNYAGSRSVYWLAIGH